MESSTAPESAPWSPGRPGWEIGLIVFVSGLAFVFVIWAVVMQNWVYFLSVLGIGSVWASFLYTSSITAEADKTKAPYVIPGLLTVLGLIITMTSTVLGGVID